MSRRQTSDGSLAKSSRVRRSFRPPKLTPLQLVLFDQVCNCLPAANGPANRQRHQRRLQRGGIDREAQLILRQARGRSIETGAHYGRPLGRSLCAGNPAESTRLLSIKRRCG